MSRVREKLKRHYKEKYKKAMGTSNRIAEDYAEGLVRWLENEKLGNGKYADVIEVFKVDKDIKICPPPVARACRCWSRRNSQNR